jgi:hypothetical protein
MRRRIFGVWRLLPTTFRVEGLKFRRRVACAVCVALLDIESRCGGKILCNQTPHLDNQYRLRSRKSAIDCLSECHHDIPQRYGECHPPMSY